MIHTTPSFKIYFGNVNDKISKKADCIPVQGPLINHARFVPIANLLGVEQLAFLNQTHGVDGFIVKTNTPAFDVDGDFLITANTNIGLGVMTADCLPIMIYDAKHHVAAAVHAGWRGSVAGIVQITIERMQKEFATRISDLQIFFGPSAKPCCYVVQPDFANNFVQEKIKNAILSMRDNQLYCDVPLLNCLQLEALNVPRKSIYLDYNICTICNHDFFSARRPDETVGRQMTIIALL